MKPRILVIDDEAGIRDSMRMILEYEGYEVPAGGHRPRRAGAGRARAPDLVFLDIKMPAMDGIEVLERLKARERRAAGGDDLGPRHGEHRGRGDAQGRLRLHREAAGQRPRAADGAQRHRPAPAARRERHPAARGRSAARDGGGQPALERVREAIGKAAPTNATVLILGESGVGKELVARAIHRNSLRARERFVQVNCAAIPEELIESELFGHEKGRSPAPPRSRSASSSRPTAARSSSTKSAT